MVLENWSYTTPINYRHSLLKTYDNEPWIRRQEITQYSTNKANTLKAIFQTKRQTHNLLENSTLHTSPQYPTILSPDSQLQDYCGQQWELSIVESGNRATLETLFKWDHFSNRNSFGRPSVKTICNNPCYTAALLIAGPAEFKDTAGEDRRWLLPTDPHDPTRRYLIGHCSAGRLVIDPTARRWLIPRWGSPRATSRRFIERPHAGGLSARQSRALTDVWTSCTSRSVFRGCRRGDETERARTNKHTATACKLARTRRQIRWPHPAGRYKLKEPSTIESLINNIANGHLTGDTES
ncbi:hypothetical protein T08_6091 [Trichinella sp. T8]|nr:hypothetical protein T08_6091 [Trichinella sp. T8]